MASNQSGLVSYMLLMFSGWKPASGVWILLGSVWREVALRPGHSSNSGKSGRVIQVIENDAPRRPPKAFVALVVHRSHW